MKAKLIKVLIYLGSVSKEQGSKRMDLAMVECLDNGDDVNCVNTTGTGTSKDGYQYMLFKTEGPGIQREAPIRKRNLYVMEIIY